MPVRPKLRTRAFELPETKDWSNNEWGRRLGVYASTIWRARTHRDGVGPELMGKLQEYFPHLDHAWLFYVEHEPNGRDGGNGEAA